MTTLDSIRNLLGKKRQTIASDFDTLVAVAATGGKLPATAADTLERYAAANGLSYDAAVDKLESAAEVYRERERLVAEVHAADLAATEAAELRDAIAETERELAALKAPLLQRLEAYREKLQAAEWKANTRLGAERKLRETCDAVNAAIEEVRVEQSAAGEAVDKTRSWLRDREGNLAALQRPGVGTATAIQQAKAEVSETRERLNAAEATSRRIDQRLRQLRQQQLEVWPTVGGDDDGR